MHILINNAAASPHQRHKNPEGIELQFATNVLGYFSLTQSFTEILKASAPTRIVNVASYWVGDLDLTDLEFKKRISAWTSCSWRWPRRSPDRPGLVAGKVFAPEHPIWGRRIGVKSAGSHLFLRYAFDDG